MESMEASDPPGYLPVGLGAPDERRTTEPDGQSIRCLVHEIREREGRPSDRDTEYRRRAKEQLCRQAAKRAGEIGAR